MRRTYKRLVAGVMVTGLGILAGCRSTPPGQPPPEPPLRLSSNQVGDVQVALARTLEQRGELRQAIQCYAEAVRNDPTRADAWVRMGVLADKEGMFTESAEYYHRALTLRPHDADTYCNLGYGLYLQQRYDQAEAALRRAVALRPDHQRAQNNLGLVLARSGRGPEALDAFRRAGCSKADSHLNLAYGMTLNGDMAGARQQYELALACEPDCDAAQKGLRNLETLVARLQPAAEAVTPAMTNRDLQPTAVTPALFPAPAPSEEPPAALPPLPPLPPVGPGQ
jgi:Flp pilus assembly protein TadD